MMKKMSVFLIINMLLCSMLISPIFTDVVSAVGQHEGANGTTYGTVETDEFPLELLEQGDHNYAIAFSNDTDWVAYADITGNVYVHWTSNWTLATTLTQPTGITEALDFSHDNQYIAYGDRNNKVNIHWVGNWTHITEISVADDVMELTFSEDNNYLGVVTSQYNGVDNYLYVYWQSNWTLAYQSSSQLDLGFRSVDFSENTVYVIYGGWSGTCYVRQTSDWSLTTTITPWVGAAIYGVEFSEDNQYLAISINWCEVYVYNQGGAWGLVHTITEPTSYIHDTAWTNDNNWLLSCGGNDKIRFFNTTTWNEEADKQISKPDTLFAIDISSDDDWVASACLNKVAYVDFIANTSYIVTRTTGATTEQNNLSFIPTRNYSDDVTLKVPVSSDAQGIVDVTNNTGSIQAIEVNASDELINNTFWYDAANHFVYIQTVNLTTSTTVNWTVNCSYGVNFNLIIPPYLEVGQYFHSEGFISDSDGNAISGMIAETRLLFDNGTDALSVNPKHNCTNGNYHCTFSTSILLPGTYSVSIEFTDPISGITFKEGATLYLSVNPGPGVYVSTFLHFAFYNNNTGIGIPSESFKIYASTDTTVDSDDRIYVDLFGVYTGQTIYYKVDDYYDNQIYPTTGDYQTLEISSLEQFEDIPITWYDLSIKNLNQTIMHFSMENSSRYYNVTLFPMDPVHINVLSGNYTVTLKFYSTINGSLLKTVTDTISISEDAFYIATGYNAMVHVSWYNTNEGLGLPDETLKLYFNDQRHTSRTYWTYINQTIKITVKDYYNLTLFEGNFTITSLYRFLDFGLTFHEYDFTNANDEYFYASFLKEGATRWYEKVVSSGGQKNFMLPSGNYTIRVYNADNSTYLSWDDTVNRSKAYLIGVDGVSLIIQGQSVIMGEFLELREELAYAFMPDVTIISRNPPMIFSVYDKEGMAFGSDSYLICPPLITIATTRVTQYGNYINSTPMIPGNGSVLNGTITIIRDVLYLSGPGSITWVNITYMNNGTLLQNTSYIPSRIDIYGQNLAINASGDILVLRVTKYNQVRKFDWTYYPFKGYGPDLERAGWHSAGIEVINPMPVPLYDVYAIAGFSDESNPDGSSVEVRDTTNGGVILDRGPNYDVTDTSIHFNIQAGMAANEIRVFTVGYYKMQQESYIYDEGIVSVPFFEITTWDGGSYNFFPAHWTNPYDRTFRGALYIKLNFDIPTEIDAMSMRIYDLTHDHELDPSLFIPGSTYIRISAEAMQDVLPGSSREFDVYFLMTEYPGADPTELHFDTPIFLGITIFLIILIIGLALIGCGGYTYVFTKNKDWWKGIVIGVFLIVFFSILTAMGI